MNEVRRQANDATVLFSQASIQALLYTLHSYCEVFADIVRHVPHRVWPAYNKQLHAIVTHVHLRANFVMWTCENHGQDAERVRW
jgi:hypothetical protein